MATGETEFGGVEGMVAPQTYRSGTETTQQATWEVYATNPSGDSADADPGRQAALGRVGRKPPRETYTPGGGLPGKGV